MRRLDLDGLCNFIEDSRRKKTLCTFHTVGDRDGVSSAVVTSSLFESAVVRTPDFVTSNARRMLEHAGYAQKIGSSFPVDVELVIVHDANKPDSLGPFGSRVERFDGELLFIDHHVEPARYVDGKNAYYFNDESYNSTASIVYEVTKRLGRQLSRLEAELLLNGVIADSADFENATAQTFRQVSELTEISKVNYFEIAEYFHYRIPAKNRFRLIEDLSKSTARLEGDYVIVFGEAERANVAADAALKLGADAAVFFAIHEKEISLSARMRSTLDTKFSLHLGKVMQGVGSIIGGNGGGHPCAAGAYGPRKEQAGKALDYVVGQIEKAMDKAGAGALG